MHDLKFALRQLLKNPGFTAVAVLTLALGIGANTAIDSFVLTGKDQPENIPGSRLSANIFRLLGVQPMIGRDFLPEEETYGKDHVVLISHELWRRRFGGDTGIIGQSITLNDERYAVIGVMPPCTFFPERNTQLWTPLAFSPEQLRDHGSHNYLVYGRLKPGVTLAQANTEMGVIAQRMAQTNEHYQGSGAEVYPLQEIMVGDSRTVLLVLLGSVGFVLLIGCVNIANLSLAS